MAKANLQAQDEQMPLKPIPKKKKKKKKKKGIIIFIAILVILGGLGFFFRKQLLTQLASLTKNIPIVNKWFKETEQATGDEALTKEELISKVAGLEKERDTLKQKVDDLTEEKVLLDQKIISLSQYEQSYMSFLEEKQAWDEDMAKKDITSFIKYYEQMFPDQAEKIYSEVKTKEVSSKSQKAFAATVAEMDEDAAAAALTQMIGTDQELVKLLFNGMPSEKRSLILSAMDAATAAQVIKLISPEISQ